MNNIEIENIHSPKQIDFVEQSRETLLRLGYRYVAFKSKLKRNIVKIKRQFVSYHT